MSFHISQSCLFYLFSAVLKHSFEVQLHKDWVHSPSSGCTSTYRHEQGCVQLPWWLGKGCHVATHTSVPLHHVTGSLKATLGCTNGRQRAVVHVLPHAQEWVVLHTPFKSSKTLKPRWSWSNPWACIFPWKLKALIWGRLLVSGKLSLTPCAREQLDVRLSGVHVNSIHSTPPYLGLEES